MNNKPPLTESGNRIYYSTRDAYNDRQKLKQLLEQRDYTVDKKTKK